MKFAPKSHRPDHENHLIALINIVFLLLIFFMLLGRITALDVLAIQPPQSSSETPVPVAELEILIGTDGQLAINGVIINLEQLASQLANQLATSAESDVQPLISVKADANIQTSQLSQVLNSLRQSGIRKITLITAQKL